MRSYTVKKNHITSALSFGTHRQRSCYFYIRINNKLTIALAVSVKVRNIKATGTASVWIGLKYNLLSIELLSADNKIK